MWAIILAVGIAMSGAFVYMGIKKFAEKDRCVTVKGLSEREVLANMATWPMTVSVEGNDLISLFEEADRKKDIVIKFLKDNNFTDKEIAVSSIDTNDRWSYDYEEARKKHKDRYKVDLRITVTTRQVDRLIETLGKQIDLLKHGIDISTDDWQVEYEYVDLSSLKPEMVEEATKNARKVAEKFAEDADCELGSIFNATQGQFTIEDVYRRPQYKNIRVVTTVAYYLK